MDENKAQLLISEAENKAELAVQSLSECMQIMLMYHGALARIASPNHSSPKDDAEMTLKYADKLAETFLSFKNVGSTYKH